MAGESILLVGKNPATEELVFHLSSGGWQIASVREIDEATEQLEHQEYDLVIADIEKRIIVQTLDGVDGSQKKAAERLRLNPTTLHEKMKRYKIIPERHRSRPAISA
jgi:DNA-binding NtrC family response regulator